MNYERFFFVPNLEMDNLCENLFSPTLTWKIFLICRPSVDAYNGSGDYLREFGDIFHKKIFHMPLFLYTFKKFSENIYMGQTSIDEVSILFPI